MKKEKKITAPEGCEIEKVELVDGAAVVTFKEKKRQLPKSWEEFCKMFPIKGNEKFITRNSYIEKAIGCQRDSSTDKNLLPDRDTAEAVLALCQLIQLRNAYNGDFVPKWDDEAKKYFITMDAETISKESYYTSPVSPLYFNTEELRDDFLRNFRPLIEKLKPLYGIKEGGEK